MPGALVLNGDAVPVLDRDLLLWFRFLLGATIEM